MSPQIDLLIVIDLPCDVDVTTMQRQTIMPRIVIVSSYTFCQQPEDRKGPVLRT